jgi:transposase
MKIDSHTIFEIHRLEQAGYKQRKIARQLGISRLTVKKYLQNPKKSRVKSAGRPSKLDAYRDLIKQWLEKDPEVSAPVVLQHLAARGFDGKVTIVRDYLRQLRGRRAFAKAYLRIESPPAEQMQVDWGHFGHLIYNQTKRKLYALAVVESFSRMGYVQFTHSQKQEVLHQCLLDAFCFFGGTAEQIVVDNMLTAVTERQGPLIRFNGRFLEFLRPFRMVPVACHIRAAHEKGKIENFIKYLRYNFMPLRSFVDLADVNCQARAWLDQVANRRLHQGTGQRPKDRFGKVTLRPLPQWLPDCRQTSRVTVYKDFAVRFDGNTYTAPPWTIGKQVTVKADATTVAIYLNEKQVAVHPRSFERKRRIEHADHRDQVRKLQKHLWHDRQVSAFSSLGQPAVAYLKGLMEANQPIRKTVAKLLSLKDQYGSASVLYAISKAATFKAFGAEYIENILYQEMTPVHHHPPVQLKDQALNNIRLNEPSLADYDALILKRRSADDRKDK